MNTRDILNQLDNIELARLDSKERMEKGEARRAILQASFDRAVVRPENLDCGIVNWNFVDADMHLDGLSPTEGEFETMVWRWEQKDAAALAKKIKDAEEQEELKEAKKWADLEAYGNKGFSPEDWHESFQG